MGLFKRKPLHERLARQGGLEADALEPEPVDPGPHWGAAGIHGVPRPRRWDAVASAEAPQLTGDEVHFVALDDGTLVVDEDVPEGALEPLAAAVEQSLDAPYRAEGVRREGDVWAVAARQTEVIEVPDDVDGDEIDIAVQGEQHTVVVDGVQIFGSVPHLERLGHERHEAFVIHAERLDDRLFEVRVAPL
jgi:hypothetical protein